MVQTDDLCYPCWLGPPYLTTYYLLQSTATRYLCFLIYIPFFWLINWFIDKGVKHGVEVFVQDGGNFTNLMLIVITVCASPNCPIKVAEIKLQIIHILEFTKQYILYTLYKVYVHLIIVWVRHNTQWFKRLLGQESHKIRFAVQARTSD